MPKFTYAIGWRHHRDREGNLARVLGWLKSFPDLDVLVVEQDNMRRFRPPPGVRHVFAHSTGPYNRSWGFNMAYRESSSPYLIFGDSDIIMRGHEFLSALEAAESLDVLSPYSSVLDLERGEVDLELDDLAKIARPGRGEGDNQRVNLCGGVVVFSREAFERVGGWDEDFVGWGGEDDMMTFKVEAAGLRSASMPYRSYHLWHHRSSPDPVQYSKTLGLLRSRVAMGGEAVLEMARGAFGNCGDKDRLK
jgi:hypothetical protein